MSKEFGWTGFPEVRHDATYRSRERIDFGIQSRMIHLPSQGGCASSSANFNLLHLRILVMKASFLIASVLVLSASLMQAGTKVLLKTNQGDITLELNDEKAPETVKNFLSYVKDGFFDKTVFHRVISGFMVQGGGFALKEDGSIEQKETKAAIQNEAKNGLKNERGTVAMARTGDPHSATAQFFINHADNGNLDYPSFDGWGYAVFGKVVSGMDVVDKIADLPTGSKKLKAGSGGKTSEVSMDDVPETTVVIESAQIVKE